VQGQPRTAAAAVEPEQQDLEQLQQEQGSPDVQPSLPQLDVTAGGEQQVAAAAVAESGHTVGGRRGGRIRKAPVRM
jgi:hypothetical protein